jgi:hypothetical protein
MSVEAFFCFITLMVAAGLCWQMPPRWRWRGAFLAALWLCVTAAVAKSGLVDFGSVPPRPMIFVVATTAATTALALSPIGREWARHAGLASLVLFQVFRIAVEVFLWWGHRDEFVPVQMTWEGWNFDVLTGLSAPLVAWLLHSGRISRTVALVWNILGLALLLNVVTIALLSMPTPLRMFLNEPSNTFVTQVPYIWLPTVLVQAAWLGHLLVFRSFKSS